MSYVKMNASKMSFIGARTGSDGYGAAAAASLYEGQILKLIKEGLVIFLDKEIKKTEQKLRKYEKGLKVPFKAPKGVKAQEVWEGAKAEINEYFIEANTHSPDFYMQERGDYYEEEYTHSSFSGWEGIEECLEFSVPRRLKRSLTSQEVWAIMAKGSCTKQEFLQDCQNKLGMSEWQFNLFLERVSLKVPSDCQWVYDIRWLTFFEKVGYEKSERILSQKEFKIRGKYEPITQEIVNDILSLTEDLVQGCMFPDLGRCRCLFSAWMDLKKASTLLSGEVLLQGNLSHFDGKEISLKGIEGSYTCVYPKTLTQLKELGAEHHWCIGTAGYNRRINRREVQLLIFIHEEIENSLCVCITPNEIEEIRYYWNICALPHKAQMEEILGLK